MPESQPSYDGQSATYVREWAVGRVLVVELHGEVDFVSAGATKACLDRLTARRRPLLLMDLRPVTFIDCAGLGVLCRARRRVRARGGRLALVIDDPRVLRTLSLAGLSRAFEVHGGLEEALVAHGAAAGHRVPALRRAVQPG
ncbi:STAS domain-containing protein [Streptomyces sp. RPT161]|uniref:STAS domain-containing protein n=1 Tax=Streptomyces sp. RPT161 TaxID=3015993 RepID=UPI0022B898E7|nr:STAS domain-containing protein [Streptomyces sp. RPT161]